MLEALRLFKESGARPGRTIRAVLFMDEEFGGTGGRDYAWAIQRREERHLAAVESDLGGFLLQGIGVGGGEDVLMKVRSWEPHFQSLGLCWIRPGSGGVDIAPLGEQGTALMSLVTDSQRYFDVHHCGPGACTCSMPFIPESSSWELWLWPFWPGCWPSRAYRGHILSRNFRLQR